MSENRLNHLYMVALSTLAMRIFHQTNLILLPTFQRVV